MNFIFISLGTIQKQLLLSSLFNISYNSRYDWIQFYDGKDQSGSILGCGKKWCGDTYPDIISTGNSIFIQFHSDTSVGTSGFNISYESGKILFSYNRN